MNRGDTVYWRGQEVYIIQIGGPRAIIRDKSGNSRPVQTAELSPTLSQKNMMATEPIVNVHQEEGEVEQGYVKDPTDDIDIEVDMVEDLPQVQSDEPHFVTRLKAMTSQYKVGQMKAFQQILMEAGSYQVVNYAKMSEMLECSTSTVRNWASGTLVPTAAMQRDVIGYIASEAHQWAVRQAQREEMLEMEREDREAAAQSSMLPQSLSKGVQLVSIQGQQYTCEITEDNGLITAYLPQLKVKCRSDNKMEAIMDVKAQALYALSGGAQAEPIPEEQSPQPVQNAALAPPKPAPAPPVPQVDPHDDSLLKRSEKVIEQVRTMATEKITPAVEDVEEWRPAKKDTDDSVSLLDKISKLRRNRANG